MRKIKQKRQRPNDQGGKRKVRGNPEADSAWKPGDVIVSRAERVSAKCYA